MKANCPMVGNIPPNGVRFPDFIAAFAMSVTVLSLSVSSHQSSEKSDMTKLPNNILLINNI